jgi:hypothetical protein
MIMHVVGTKRRRGTYLAHDHRGLGVGSVPFAAAKVTGGGRRPYHRRVKAEVGTAADAVVLVKRRAVDLCRVAACLCPMP